MSANAVLDRCESTNDQARRLGESGSPHGTWISARVQTQGRGRLGRKWESIEGNLFLSMIVRIQDKSLWTWVPLTAAVGLVNALRKWHSELPVFIKWPNDLWTANGSKLGGILCEAIGNKTGSFIIVGVGLNCDTAPEGLDQKVSSLSVVLHKTVTADDVRDLIVEGLIEAFEKLKSYGPQAIVADYEKWSALRAGAEIEWRTNAGERQAAQVRGLGSSGELIVKNNVGEEFPIYAEDVSVRRA